MRTPMQRPKQETTEARRGSHNALHARVAQVIQRLREDGFRLTPQRLAVARALVESDRHPGAEDVYASLHRAYPTMSKATVYSTMRTLAELGEAQALEFQHGGTRYDGRRPEPHMHLICTRCGGISDLAQEPVTSAAMAAAKRAGFATESYRFDLYGVCAACQGRA